MISKKIFVYNCYNLDGNNTTLNVIRGVWTERDVFLCVAEMVMGHLIPEVATFSLLLIKSFLSLIHLCSAAFRVKNCTYAEHLASSCTVWTRLTGQTTQMPTVLFSWGGEPMTKVTLRFKIESMKVWNFHESKQIWQMERRSELSLELHWTP